MPTSAAASAGGIVDAVAGHRHDASFVLEPLHDGDLVLRQHLGDDVVDPELSRDRLGGRLAVARQHHHSDAHAAQCGDRLRRGRLDRVGDTDEATEAPIDADEDDGRGGGSDGLGRRRDGTDFDASPGQEGRAAADDGRAIDRARHALALQRVEIADGRQIEPAIPRCGEDGGAQRMFAGTLDAREPAQQQVGVEPIGRLQGRDPGLALRERAGLVDHDGVDPLHALQRPGVANQHTDPCAHVRRRP